MHLSHINQNLVFNHESSPLTLEQGHILILPKSDWHLYQASNNYKAFRFSTHTNPPGTFQVLPFITVAQSIEQAVKQIVKTINIKKKVTCEHAWLTAICNTIIINLQFLKANSLESIRQQAQHNFLNPLKP